MRRRTTPAAGWPGWVSLTPPGPSGWSAAIWRWMPTAPTRTCSSRARRRRRSRPGAGRAGPDAPRRRAGRGACGPTPGCAPGSPRCSGPAPPWATTWPGIRTTGGVLRGAGRAAPARGRRAARRLAGRRRAPSPDDPEPVAGPAPPPAATRPPRCAAAYRRRLLHAGRARPHRRSHARRGRRRTGRPGRRRAGGGAGHRPVAAARRVGARPAGGDRHGQMRRPRAELRQRRGRDLRGGASPGTTPADCRGAGPRPRIATPAGAAAGRRDPAEARRCETAALRTATRLAAGLIRVCSQSTPEGALFPVDPNLRPEGRDGPLVRTLASHRAYYDRWAKTWEFQALLKARPVAGDLALGRGLRRTRSARWSGRPRSGDNFVADVQAMRRRVIGTLPGREPAASSSWARRAARHRVRGAAAAAGARPGRRDRSASRPRCPRWPRWPRAATSAGRTRPAWPPPTGSCARSSTCSSCASCGARTPCRTTRPCCAGSAGRCAGPRTRRRRTAPARPPSRADPAADLTAALAAARRRGPAAAREAVLPAAAGRGGPAARRGGPADPRGGAGPAGGARATPTRPGRCATSRR